MSVNEWYFQRYPIQTIRDAHIAKRTAESLLCSPLLQGCKVPLYDMSPCQTCSSKPAPSMIDRQEQREARFRQAHSCCAHPERNISGGSGPELANPMLAATLDCAGKNRKRLTLGGVPGGSGSSSVLPAPVLATPVLGLLLPVPRLLAIPGVPAIARLLPVAWPLRVLLHGHICRPLRQR